jgi:hypothetical protein
MKKQYIVTTITQGRLDALFFSGSNVSFQKLEAELIRKAAADYEMTSMVIKQVRSMIFWKRERIVLIFKHKPSSTI